MFRFKFQDQTNYLTQALQALKLRKRIPWSVAKSCGQKKLHAHRGYMASSTAYFIAIFTQPELLVHPHRLLELSLNQLIKAYVISIDVVNYPLLAANEVESIYQNQYPS